MSGVTTSGNNPEKAQDSNDRQASRDAEGKAREAREADEWRLLRGGGTDG